MIVSTSRHRPPDSGGLKNGVTWPVAVVGVYRMSVQKRVKFSEHRKRRCDTLLTQRQRVGHRQPVRSLSFELSKMKKVGTRVFLKENITDFLRNKSRENEGGSVCVSADQ